MWHNTAARRIPDQKMHPSKFFLRTKLLPPRSLPEVLERPRLLDRLKGNLSSPVTMVAADAGCGKTTLIAEFIRGQNRPAVWYQLDYTDADPAVFLGYLALGIRDFSPDFGTTFFQYVEEAGGELAQLPERAVDLLINEIMNTVEQPFIVVLDDYHHIGRETVVHKLVDRLLQYSSDLLHIIITTRDLPPLAIMRRRAQSSAMMITREDLLFTDAEVRELFGKTLNIELKDEEIAEYGSRTHGWVTALQLIRQVAEREIHSGPTGRVVDLGEILQQSEKDIFDYFAEEVISRESRETEKLFLYLSLLETLPLDVCSRLFPQMRCSAVLPEIAQKNVFLTVAGDAGAIEEYRFHPLFRDFLRRRLRSEIGQAAVAEERIRIAEFFLESGKAASALPFLIDAEDFDRAAEIVAKSGENWIASGAFTSFRLIAEKIPQASLERHPRSLLHLAEVARLQGESERSGTLLQRAVRLCNESNDASGEAEALHSLASLARRRGDIGEALKLLEKSEQLAEPDSETLLKCANTRGLCLVADGNRTEAEQQFRIALEIAERNSNDHYIRLVAHNLALAPGFRGDFAEALRWFRRIFRDGEPDKQLPQEAIGHLNVARLHLYRGEFADTESHLEKALELCQLYNLKPLRGEIFETYANFFREKADFARAEEYYERASTAYDEAGIDITTRELLEEQAKFYLIGGDPARARMLLDNQIRSRREARIELGTRTAELCVCQIDLAEKRLDGLATRITDICEAFSVQGNHYDEALAAMLLAQTYQALGDEPKTIAPLQRVLDISARFDYEYWLKGEISKHQKLFSHEDIFERLPLDLRVCVTEAKKAAGSARPHSDIAQPQSAPAFQSVPAFGDLTINLLGPVNIYRDAERPFAPDAWTTRRARDIFCCVATAKHRRVAKDVLIDIFWEDEDPGAVEKNFHPTISLIRKALNSRQPFKQNFLIFRDGAYQLNPDLTYSIDTEEFELAIAEAEKAKREKDTEKLRESLERANALYRGEFLEGSYDNWVEERRQFYREQNLRMIGALAKLSYAEKSWAAVTKLCSQILAADPFREDVHRLMMKTFAAQGKPASVKKHFDEMSKLMKTELGIEPAAETRKIYKDLMA
jgi:LuxR family maltose regulon positive regulatory protein